MGIQPEDFRFEPDAEESTDPDAAFEEACRLSGIDFNDLDPV